MIRSDRRSVSRKLAGHIGAVLSPLHFRGKWRVSGFVGKVVGLMTPDADCYPVPEARITVPLGDRIGRLMWTGCYETEFLAFLRFALRPGSVFADIGANTGYFSVVAAALVGKGGEVFAFEPDPDCFHRLSGNSQAFPWMNALQSAVGDLDGEITFYRSNRRGESGWGTTFDEGEGKIQVTVPVCTLDRFFGSRRTGRLDLIKVDVEGAEYRVLTGARRTLESQRSVIWMEANDACLARDGKSIVDLVQLLRTWGYIPMGLEEAASRTIGTIVAFPEERLDIINRARELPLALMKIPARIVSPNPKG